MLLIFFALEFTLLVFLFVVLPAFLNVPIDPVYFLWGTNLCNMCCHIFFMLLYALCFPIEYNKEFMNKLDCQSEARLVLLFYKTLDKCFTG